MGQLVDGTWRDEWYDTKKSGGKFVRWDSAFRNWVTPDGGPGPTGEAGFKADAGRYLLYIGNFCPWAHRTAIVRRLKGLEDMVALSVVAPGMGPEGWFFGDDEAGGLAPDPTMGASHLHQIYTAARKNFSGRVSVPVLWDKRNATIVSNESSEIIRMFNSAFDGVGGDASLDLYPEALRAEIDSINALVYDNINNGVYKCGFATTQEAYDDAFDNLFAALDEVEARLGRRRYLAGDRVTEADWRLFATLVRFDAAYVGNFKCNKRRIVEYPNLWGYARELYQVPGVAGTVNFDHIKRSYYSLRRVNPTGIVPKGPEIDFAAPHDRGALAAA